MRLIYIDMQHNTLYIIPALCGLLSLRLQTRRYVLNRLTWYTAYTWLTKILFYFSQRSRLACGRRAHVWHQVYVFACPSICSVVSMYFHCYLELLWLCNFVSWNQIVNTQRCVPLLAFVFSNGDKLLHSKALGSDICFASDKLIHFQTGIKLKE